MNAFERAIGDDEVLWYHIDDGSERGGWVSCRRNSSEPQVEVIDVIQGDATLIPKQVTSAVDSRLSASMRHALDLDKLFHVSPRRAGFMAFSRFHSMMRHVLNGLSWTCLPQPQSTGIMSYASRSTSQCACKILPLIINSLSRLLPMLPRDVTPLKPVNEDVMSGENLSSTFFALLRVPGIASFNCANISRTMHAVELCLCFLVEDPKGGTVEANPLLLVHLFYDGFIEKLMIATCLVFLTCIGGSDTPQSASFCAVPSTRMSSTSILDYQTPVACTVDFDDDNDGDVKAEDSTSREQPLETILKRMVLDRRDLAAYMVDILIVLWGNLFKGISSESHVSSGILECTDANHAFDPPVFKRKLFVTLVRYINQAWTHDKLHTLPPTSVKNILDLMHVAIESLYEAKESPLRSRVRAMPPSARSRSSRHHLFFDSPVDPLDPIDMPGMEFLRESSLEEPFIRPRSRRNRFRQGSESLRSIRQRDTASITDMSEEQAPLTHRTGVSASAISTTATVGEQRNSSDMNTPFVHILPLIPKSPDNELERDRAVMCSLYKHTYTIVPQACLMLIERGVGTGEVQWSAKAATLNRSFTRELTTVVVLKQMLKCLERPKWSDSTLKIIQLTSLYRRVVTLLEGGLTPQTCLSLYGLLHAILLLLSGKVISPHRSGPRSNEMMFLVFGRAGRFKVGYLILLGGSVEMLISCGCVMCEDVLRPLVICSGRNCSSDEDEELPRLPLPRQPLLGLDLPCCSHSRRNGTASSCGQNLPEICTNRIEENQQNEGAHFQQRQPHSAPRLHHSTGADCILAGQVLHRTWRDQWCSCEGGEQSRLSCSSR